MYTRLMSSWLISVLILMCWSMYRVPSEWFPTYQTAAYQKPICLSTHDEGYLQVLEDENEAKAGLRDALREWVAEHSTRYKNIRMPDSQIEEVVESVLETQYPFEILSMIEVESRFNPYAVSSKGAIGLCQITEIHFPELIEAGIIEEPSDLFKISNAVKACEFILLQKFGYHKTLYKAIQRYNGIGPESERYIQRVKTNLRKLKKYAHLSI